MEHGSVMISKTQITSVSPRPVRSDPEASQPLLKTTTEPIPTVQISQSGNEGKTDVRVIDSRHSTGNLDASESSKPKAKGKRYSLGVPQVR